MSERFPEGSDPAQVLGEAIKKGLLSVRGKVETFVGNLHDVADGLDAARKFKSPTPTEDFTSPRSKHNAPLGHIELDATFYPYEFGFFAAESLSNPGMIQIFSEIQINERDLDSFLHRHFFWSFSGQDGRRRADDAWLALTLTLIRLERDGRLNDKHFPDAASLRSEVLLVSHHVFDERTIRASVDAIFAACVSGFTGSNWRDIRESDESFDPLRSIRAVATRDNS